jgi:tetratricopeptide (TPR) repeat protein
MKGKKYLLSLLFALIFCLLLTTEFDFVQASIIKDVFNEKQEFQRAKEIANLALEERLNGNLSQAEKHWTEIITQFPHNPEFWQNGENLKGFQDLLKEAIADYDQVLILNPKDAKTFNNRGNAEVGLGNWKEALADYQKAVALEPDFSLAIANESYVLYELGQSDESLEIMRNLVRRFPLFAEPRAALTALLWDQGFQGEAESNWVSAVGINPHYQDIDWIKQKKRWPPKMINALNSFFSLN